MSGARAGISGAEINKGGVGAATVKRYWPGKAPDWVNEDDDEDASDQEVAEEEAEVQALKQPVCCLGPDGPIILPSAHLLSGCAANMPLLREQHRGASVTCANLNPPCSASLGTLANNDAPQASVCTLLNSTGYADAARRWCGQSSSRRS